MQRGTLLSLKTGECPEDCAYCAQSTHNCAEIELQPLLTQEQALAKARLAKNAGASRFCMSAAWREVEDGPEFERVLEIVQKVADLGLEPCCTLGMISRAQAERLKAAGCVYYNHNLDTSPEYYAKIVTTHNYQDRLRTLRHVRQAGLKLCSGGIVGMGEPLRERLEFLKQLTTQNPHPDSVPLNLLVPITGTPLENSPILESIEYVRLVATARIVLPRSLIRVAAGRMRLSPEAQALCFLAGANSIFCGEKLLTTPNTGEDEDRHLMERLGLKFAGESAMRRPLD